MSFPYTKPFGHNEKFLTTTEKDHKTSHQLIPEGMVTSRGVIVPPEMSLLTVSFPLSVFVILALIFRTDFHYVDFTVAIYK